MMKSIFNFLVIGILVVSASCTTSSITEINLELAHDYTNHTQIKWNGITGRFIPVFWSPVHFPNQPGTMGLLMDATHAAFNDFPTSNYTEWQWWDAMSHSNAISLESFSSTPEPIVRIIDDWVTNKKLALIFEAKVGNGKLLITGVDLQSELRTRPEARQMLYSLKNYMAGQHFSPKTELSAEEIINLFTL